MPRRYFLIAFVCASCFILAGPAASAAENLLMNGDFATPGGPAGAAGWMIAKGQQSAPVIDTVDKPAEAAWSLHVEIRGGGDGVIYQKIEINPQTEYVVKGQMKGSEARLCYISLRYYKDGEDGARINTDRSTSEWRNVSQTFNSGSANKAVLMLRFDAQQVGKHAWFADVHVESVSP
jgi:Carbohydrate binding domain